MYLNKLSSNYQPILQYLYTTSGCVNFFKNFGLVMVFNGGLNSYSHIHLFNSNNKKLNYNIYSL